MHIMRHPAHSTHTKEGFIHMNEKFFKLVANTGISNLVMGIIVIVTGVTSGVILIVSGAKIMKKKDDLMI